MNRQQMWQVAKGISHQSLIEFNWGISIRGISEKDGQALRQQGWEFYPDFAGGSWEWKDGEDTPTWARQEPRSGGRVIDAQQEAYDRFDARMGD